MPSAATPASFRSRAGAIAVVIGGHVAMLLLLTAEREPGSEPGSDERMTLVFIDRLDVRPPVVPTVHPRASRSVPGRVTAPAPAAAPVAASDEPGTVSPGIDWYANGSEAAQRAAAEPTTRNFGFPRREPAPRARKPFAWDKVHTERVHALDGGGIGVHLSDNCELVIAPFPFAGCAFGKRKARGDLFDEMQAPD